MLNQIFFSFDYERDFYRANLVRGLWVEKHGAAESFWDAEIWEKIKSKGSVEFQKIINEAIQKTSLTVVLIGSNTSKLDYVQYAIVQSAKQGKGIIGIRIHNIKDEKGETASIGSARFGEINRNKEGESLFFWQLYPVYRWVIEDGESNLKNWVEQAYKKANNIKG